MSPPPVVYDNAPTKAPDLEGMGRAWKVTAPDAAAHEQDADCGSWLLNAPHGHPFWTWYIVCAVHLRPLEGQPPPNLQFPGASHEWMVLALNPEKPLPDVDRWGSPGTPPMSLLTPPDQTVQFIVANDDQARELCELTIRHILEGHSPDQDFRAYWKQAVANTAEHLRLGGHPDREAS